MRRFPLECKPKIIRRTDAAVLKGIREDYERAYKWKQEVGVPILSVPFRTRVAARIEYGRLYISEIRHSKICIL